MNNVSIINKINMLTKPRHILDEIVLHKRQEVAQMRLQSPLAKVQEQLKDAPKVRDFLQALQDNSHHPSLIAEVKKASPSKGIIREDFDPISIAQAYERGGAACLSVLTDAKFFQGSFDNLRNVRKSVELPLLCKEFIIDLYQIYLARTAGADAVLLIAGILSDVQLKDFLRVIHSLKMTGLVEVHTLAELDRVIRLSDIKLVGINNRNLKNFTVDLANTEELIAQRKSQLQSFGITVVSESGIYTPEDLAFANQVGARAVLVGESLVKQPDVEDAVRKLLN
ncbi:indole-3-glycerol phosphate synthase TrpC [Rivularia sp. UHCC 0363]|uniref:indole-3-glycerol phosphate synthase TrpC n=1 Tax=Rivularia sp. UHCC 0363 TaxID=3110244 RepID=UPI002B2186DB|nr:indole-3-glycerol phosphate synthase TrpC [Rivularia sp. UHCC 0363]MEA5594966.1 indole-3-glycerol phosphate synthase TrpC [Rivularia sp. UHCC 0363]